MAKILTINDCTGPCSHYSVPKWAKRNALAEVLNIDLGGLNHIVFRFNRRKMPMAAFQTLLGIATQKYHATQREFVQPV
jgi:hypothetical protein